MHNLWGQVGVDVKGSHVYRAWGEMYRQSMAFRATDNCTEGLAFIAFSRKLKEIDDALNRCGLIATQFAMRLIPFARATQDVRER